VKKKDHQQRRPLPILSASKNHARPGGEGAIPIPALQYQNHNPDEHIHSPQDDYLPGEHAWAYIDHPFTEELECRE
jgi:hypothetical protein